MEGHEVATTGAQPVEEYHERVHMVQDYQCADKKCGARDVWKLCEGETAVPIAVNCWSCKAGQGKDVQEMLARRIGMFPVGSPRPA